jgi:hypothetical protein
MSGWIVKATGDIAFGRTAERAKRGDVQVGDLARRVGSDRVGRVCMGGLVVDAPHSPCRRGEYCLRNEEKL